MARLGYNANLSSTSMEEGLLVTQVAELYAPLASLHYPLDVYLLRHFQLHRRIRLPKPYSTSLSSCGVGELLCYNGFELMY